MQALFEFLKANPYLLLFFTVAAAVLLGKWNHKGLGLGLAVSAVLVGCALGAWASSYGIKLQFDPSTKALFYALFVYGLGLRLGPSIIHCFRKDRLKFTLLAFISSVTGLVIVLGSAKLFGLPPGAAGGILAGSQTMGAAIGTAEMAVTQGSYPLPPGSTAESVSSMIALSYAVTCLWGAAGMVFLSRCLPRLWRMDANQAARKYEAAHGVTSLNKSALTGYRAGAMRAYVLQNSFAAGQSIGLFRQKYPQYHILHVVRDGSPVEVTADELLQAGDTIALGGRIEDLTANLGVIGPEVADEAAIDLPIDHAEILVTEANLEGRPLKSFRNEDFAGQLQLLRIERGGVPLPLGAETELQRLDVLFVAGIKGAVHKLAALAGNVARPGTATHVLTLSIGIILGLLIGQITVRVGSLAVGLGNAGGLLLSGILVSSIVSRARFLGNMPAAARNFLEDFGLVAFIATVGINAGSALLAQLPGKTALFIFLAGFIASTVPPIVTWAIGCHVFKINPAVLIGGVAGSRFHFGAAAVASRDLNSNVPWVGFPVAYAVSGILLSAFGYMAMLVGK